MKMFDKLTEYSYERKGWQIVGFYIAYLILVVVLSILSATVFGISLGRFGDEEFAYNVSLGFGVVTITTISFLLAKAKNSLNNPTIMLVVLLSGVLVYIGGGLLGLIPTSYISSRKTVK